ncbi:MAG: sulfite oxidase [Acidimicrobiia bacterium]|nr:sulfite oxidase [Acidimicrobiia bacterium]
MELLPVEQDPFNAETPLAALDAAVTPNDLFYVRNHFAVPSAQEALWRLQVAGDTRQELSLDDLKRFPFEEVAVTLECAGNGRELMDPTPEGTPWRWGAVATARFGGTPLSDLLTSVGVPGDGVEVVATGADSGEVDGSIEQYSFSVPLDIAMSDGAIVAWRMNGDPLPPDHGFPLRLVVGGSYGMASVKWLTSLAITAKPFAGHFVGRYRYEDDSAGRSGPVGPILVRSLMARPAEGDRVSGEVELTGSAWSGLGAIVSVEVSTDGGDSWAEAELQEAESRYAATIWTFRWSAPGPGSYELVCRATDAAGNTQPALSTWNSLGYGNNHYHSVSVEVTD